MKLRWKGSHPVYALLRVSSASVIPSWWLRPLVGTTFPLEDAAKALAHLSDRKAIGKTIITMGR